MTTKQELLKKLDEVRQAIKRGEDVENNKRRERYLVDRLRGET